MEQLLLRQWRDADLKPFAEMNSDREVMEFFGILRDKTESLALMGRFRREIEERGWGLWAVECDGEFIGFTGLSIPSFEAHFMPCTEIGWSFRREYWGRGLAYRAAGEALKYGFEKLNLREIVAFTAAVNLRSRRLMERLGFERDRAGDFEHPRVPEGSLLRPHVLFRLGKENYFARTLV